MHALTVEQEVVIVSDQIGNYLRLSKHVNTGKHEVDRKLGCV